MRVLGFCSLVMRTIREHQIWQSRRAAPRCQFRSLSSEAVEDQESVQSASGPGNIATILAALKKCSRSRDIVGGRNLHSQIDRSRLHNIFVDSALIDMYAKCGSMAQAQSVFDAMAERNTVSWNSLIRGYVDNGSSRLALDLFFAMEEAEAPTERTFLAALNACAGLARNAAESSKSLEIGKAVHSRAIRSSCCDVFVESALVDLYAKCGKMYLARSVFDGMAKPNVVSWNCLIWGYVDNGDCDLGLDLFDRLDESKDEPDSRSCVAAITAVAGVKSMIERGKSVHSRAVMNSWCDIFVQSVLVDMYAKCGRMVHARAVFDGMQARDVVAWNSLLHGYVDNGENELALRLFGGMEEASGGCLPDDRSYVAALTACGNLARDGDDEMWLEKGKAIHSQAVNFCCCDIFVENTLINMYARFGRMAHARCVFDSMVRRNTVSWTSLLQGYVEAGQSDLALSLFDNLDEEAEQGEGGRILNARTYVAALTACITFVDKESGSLEKAIESRKWLEKVKTIHSRAVMDNCCDTWFESTLVDTYSKCCGMLHARSVFDNMADQDIVSWNALLQGYADNEESEVVLQLFDDSSVEELNSRAIVAALSACTSLAARRDGGKYVDSCRWLEKGKFLHSLAVMNNCCDIFVETALVNMYAKCGSKLYHANNVFQSMAQHNPVSWNCLIQGYLDKGENDMALHLIAHMDANGMGVNHTTFVAALVACGNLMALQTGKWFHHEIRSSKLVKDHVVVANALVDFYAKCGSMETAKLVFDSVSEKTMVTWNTLLCGYSLQGDTQRAFELFETMEKKGVSPNEITFVYLLHACSHSGMVARGRQYFEAMQLKYGIRRDVIHYSCMVDLLGRANHLEEALNLVKSMPCEPNVITWKSLLAACRKWNNTTIGKIAYESLLRLDDKNAAAYVLMANIYGSTVVRDDFESMPGSKMYVCAGCTDDSGKVHEFESFGDDIIQNDVDNKMRDLLHGLKK